MDKWVGRVALVTGASAGIGYVTTKKLVQSGMKVVGAARNIEKIQDLALELSGERGSLTAVKCDLTNDEDVYKMFETLKSDFGGVDLCINNAGTTNSKSLLDGNPEEWRDVMNLNVIAVCLCTKLAIQSMRERGVDDGHVVILSSLAGHRVSQLLDGRSHFYSASKFAVEALCEGFRQEVKAAKSHIRITGISPGVVKTEIHSRNFSPEFAKGLYSSMEFLNPEDIADVILQALSAPSHVEICNLMIKSTEQS